MDTVYDRALLEVGHDGIFQKKFDLLYNFVFSALWGMAYMNIFLALVITPHWCQIPEKMENISEYSWKQKYIPILNNTTGMYNSCSIYANPGKDNSIKKCDAYIYDKTWYESTVPSDNDWVCEDEIKVADIFAYSKIGEAVGSVFFGWFGDIYGRRLTYIISLLFLVVGRIISIVSSKSFILFASGCIIAWIPSWSAVQSATVISMEISSPERRSLTATLRSVSNSLGMCLMPLLYWWLRDWKIFMIVTSLTQLPYFLLSWRMIESPRWLWIQGKPAHCIKELKVIAKKNNKKLEAATQEEILLTEPVKTSQALGPLALFFGWKLAIHTTLQSYLWIAVSLNYTILLMKTGEKSDGNPFLEFAWQSVAEMPGTFFGAWLADRIGRRYAGLVSFSSTAILWVLIAIREKSMIEWIMAGSVGTTMIILNRLFTTSSYYVIYLFSMELYPTCLRQSGMSLGNVLSSGAGAIAPYLMYWGHHTDSRLPCVLLSVVSVVGVVSSLLLPETLNAKLPETLKDAQEFGKREDQYLSVRLKRRISNNNV